MFFLSDVNSVEFQKRKSKVKSYVRKGRIVRQYDREFDSKAALIGGLGTLGIGALATGAYFLSKGKIATPKAIPAVLSEVPTAVPTASVTVIDKTKQAFKKVKDTLMPNPTNKGRKLAEDITVVNSPEGQTVTKVIQEEIPKPKPLWKRVLNLEDETEAVVRTKTITKKVKPQGKSSKKKVQELNDEIADPTKVKKRKKKVQVNDDIEVKPDKDKPKKPVIPQVNNADEIADKVISKLPKHQIQQPIDTDDIVNRVVSKLPKQEVVDVDDIVNRVSKVIPKPVAKVKVIKSKAKQQSLTKQDIEDVVSNALSKQPKQQNTNIDYDEITKRLATSLPKQQIQPTGNIDNISNVIDVPISKIKLPQKINSLSQKTIDTVTKQVEDMSDDQLEREIRKYSKQFEKSTKTQLDISNARTLEGYIDQYKEGSKKFDKGYLKKQIDELLDYFKLPKQDIEQVKYNFDIDKEYVSKLNKLRTRNKNLLDIHQNELTKRRNKPTNNTRSDEDVSRIYDLLDDFSAANDLIEFCNNMNQLNDSYLFFLSDFK